MVIGLCVVRFFWYDFFFFFFGKYYDWRTFFWKKNFFDFYVVILKNTMKGFMINFVNFVKYIYIK